MKANIISIERMVKERDEALRSLDEVKIKVYAKKYKVKLPENKTIFWAGVHKARMCVSSLTAEEKRLSHDWLQEHGFSDDIGGGFE